MEAGRRGADSLRAVLDIPGAGGLSMLMDGQSAVGNGAVPFPQVLSLLCLSVQLGFADLKKKKCPDTSLTPFVQPGLVSGRVCCALPFLLEAASWLATAALMNRSAAAQGLRGLWPQANRKACWAWTAHRAAGSSSASSHSSETCLWAFPWASAC